MGGLPTILTLFRNEFNKFNNTRARMIDSIYHNSNLIWRPVSRRVDEVIPSDHPRRDHLYVTSPQKQVTDVSLVLKDSDMDSENLSSLIRLSVSDGQTTDSSKVVSVIGI